MQLVLLRSSPRMLHANLVVARAGARVGGCCPTIRRHMLRKSLNGHELTLPFKQDVSNASTGNYLRRQLFSHCYATALCCAVTAFDILACSRSPESRSLASRTPVRRPVKCCSVCGFYRFSYPGSTDWSPDGSGLSVTLRTRGFMGSIKLVGTHDDMHNFEETSGSHLAANTAVKRWSPHVRKCRRALV